MNLTSSHPFWSVSNGLPANYPSLQRDIRCDVVVVGGGITGALVAIHLTEAGVKTVIIDKRDIGTGSTSASTALLQYEIDVPLRELIQKVGPVAATRSYQLCRESIGKLEQLAARLKIDCGDVTSLFQARGVVSLGPRKDPENERQAIYDGREDPGVTASGSWRPMALLRGHQNGHQRC